MTRKRYATSMLTPKASPSDFSRHRPKRLTRIRLAVGHAQTLLDFMLWMHFIKPVYVIEPFSLGRPFWPW
jgi:hypothetical protein